jgi:hypothetical protein
MKAAQIQDQRIKLAGTKRKGSSNNHRRISQEEKSGAIWSYIYKSTTTKKNPNPGTDHGRSRKPVRYIHTQDEEANAHRGDWPIGSDQGCSVFFFLCLSFSLPFLRVQALVQKHSRTDIIPADSNWKQFRKL